MIICKSESCCWIDDDAHLNWADLISNGLAVSKLSWQAFYGKWGWRWKTRKRVDVWRQVSSVNWFPIHCHAAVKGTEWGNSSSQPCAFTLCSPARDTISSVWWDFDFFSPSWSCVRLHESKLNICWETFLIIRMQWITCFAVVNLLLLRWNGQRHKHDTYLHRLGMKSRAKFLRSVPCFNSIVQPWMLNMPLCEPH